MGELELLMNDCLSSSLMDQLVEVEMINQFIYLFGSWAYKCITWEVDRMVYAYTLDLKKY